jgi:hypothetical protein
MQDRFWAKVDIGNSNVCWNWTGTADYRGYGKFGTNGTTIGSHALAWSLFNKLQIPLGKCVLHRCDNPSCCNPYHLYLGSPADNMLDRENRCPVSKELSGVSKAKLRHGEVWLIRKLNRKFPYELVCKMFKVSKYPIYRIWSGKKYLCKEGYYI